MWRSGEISIQVLLIERSPLLRIKGLFNWSPLHSHYMRVWLRKSRTEWLLKRISVLYSENQSAPKNLSDPTAHEREHSFLPVSYERGSSCVPSDLMADSGARSVGPCCSPTADPILAPLDPRPALLVQATSHPSPPLQLCIAELQI
jgi:hypothetical protein